MTEYFFDTLEGKLLVGEAAVKYADAQLYAGQLAPLPELLTTDNFDFKPGDFEVKWTYRAWSREEKIQLGQWAIQLLEQAEVPSKMLKSEHLYRLHVLGLAPSHGALREFGDFDTYRALVGSEIDNYGHFGTYSNWSTQEYVAYARKLQKDLGRKPKTEDYMAADGPPYHFIYSRIGGTRKLNAYLGYPNINEWDDDDYIAYGVKVMQANQNETFAPNLVRLLSKHQRGPGARTVIRRFSTWSNFKQQVTDKFEMHRQTVRSINQFKMVRQAEILKDTELFESLTHGSILNFDEASARYLVVGECLPYVSKNRKIQLSKIATSRFITELRKIDSSLTAGHIENVAVILDVFDDIWPIDDDLATLTVDPDELAQARASQRDINRRSRQNTQQQKSA